jgi:tetratricopeptide (TPR) repeat protein
LCKVAEKLGDLATLAGKYNDALEYYLTAANMAGEKDLARIRYKQGEVCERSGDLEGAQTHFSAGLDVLHDGLLDAVGASRLFAAWSRACLHGGDPDCALKLVNKALELAGDNSPALMQAHNVAGMLARSTEDYRSARQNLETSLKLAEESGDPLARAAAMNNLALVMVDQDDMEKALELAHAALSISQKLGDRHREAALLNTLADISHHAGRAEQAMDYLKQAVAIFAEIGQSSATLQPEIWKLTEW